MNAHRASTSESKTFIESNLGNKSVSGAEIHFVFTRDMGRAAKTVRYRALMEIATYVAVSSFLVSNC